MPDFFAETGGLDDRIEQSRKFQDELRREIDLLQKKLGLEQQAGGSQQLTDSTGSPRSSLPGVPRTAPTAAEGSFFSTAATAVAASRITVGHVGSKIPTSSGITGSQTFSQRNADTLANKADYYQLRRSLDIANKMGGSNSQFAVNLIENYAQADPKKYRDLIGQFGSQGMASAERLYERRITKRLAMLSAGEMAVARRGRGVLEAQWNANFIAQHMDPRVDYFHSIAANVHGVQMGVGEMISKAGKSPAAQAAVFGKLAARSHGVYAARTVEPPSWASPEAFAIAQAAVGSAQNNLREAERNLLLKRRLLANERMRTPEFIAEGLQRISAEVGGRTLGGEFLAMQAATARRRQRFGRAMKREAVYALDRFKAAGGLLAPMSEVKSIVSSTAKRAAYRGAAAVKAQGGLIGKIVNPATVAGAGKAFSYLGQAAVAGGVVVGGAIAAVKAAEAINRKYLIEPLQKRASTLEASMSTNQMVHEAYLEDIGTLGAEEAGVVRRELRDQATQAKERIRNAPAGNVFDRFSAFVTQKISGINPIEEEQAQKGEQQGQRVAEIAKLKRRLGKRFDISAGQVQADVSTAKQRVLERAGIFERLSIENPDMALGYITGKTRAAVMAEVEQEASKIALERARTIELAHKRSKQTFLRTPQRRYNDQEFRRKREATKDFVLSSKVQWNPY